MDNVIRSVAAALTCVMCGSLSPNVAAAATNDNSVNRVAPPTAHTRPDTSVSQPRPTQTKDTSHTHSPVTHSHPHVSAVHKQPLQAKLPITPDVHASASSSEPAPLLTFSVISDIHLRAGVSDWGYAICDRTAENKFAGALHDLHAIDARADAMVINGDLTVTGLPSDYADMIKVFKHNPHPANTLFSIGNHEFYAAFYGKSGKRNVRTFPNGVTEETCVSRFLANTRMPALYYDRWIEGYHFIVLGTEQSIITNRKTGDGAYLSDQQLNWLKQQLAASPVNQPVFVFLHEPIPGSVAGTLKYDVRDASKLVNVLQTHPQVILFTGHTHRTLKSPQDDVYHNGYTEFNDSSVRYPVISQRRWLTDSEGLYVKVYRDKVVVKSRDFTHHVWIHDYIVPVYPNYLHFMRSQP